MTNATKAKQRADRPSKAQRQEAERRHKHQRTLVLGIGGLVAVVMIAAILLTGGGSSDTPPSAVGQVTIAPTSGAGRRLHPGVLGAGPRRGHDGLVGVRGQAGRVGDLGAVVPSLPG